MRFFVFILFLIINILSFHTLGHANKCVSAIYKASHRTKVPTDVLMAVALTETGTRQNGRLAPYPWAINVEGRGYLFPTKAKAIKAVQKYLKQGKTSIDIGCMQLNWYWHGQKFDKSLTKAFNPTTNTRVGANYIKEHYRKYKNWHKAVGRYHSGTQKFAKKYIRKYARNLKIAQTQLMIKHTPVNKNLYAQKTSPQPQRNTQRKSSKIKPQRIYKFARLNKSPGSLFAFKAMNMTQNISDDLKKSKYLLVAPKENLLPKAPKPILNSARNKRLFD